MIPSVFAATLAIGLTVVGLVGWTLWRAHEDAWRNAAIAADNLAMTVARAVEGNFAFYQRALLAAARALDDADDTDDPDTAPQRVLAGMTVGPELGPIAITDAAGHVIAATRTPSGLGAFLGERGFFAQARDGTEDRLELSKPFKLAGDENWHIALARRLSRRDGGFDGIVVGILPVAGLRAVTEMLNVGHRGAVTLLRRDGVVITRTPFHDSDVGRRVGGGPAIQQLAARARSRGEARASLDGVNRLFSFSRVGELPLVVAVGMSTDDVYADWRGQAAILGTVTLVLVLALLLGSLALLRELARRRAAEAAARAGAARYRLLADHSSDIILRLDGTGAQRYVSPSIKDILGCEPATLLGWNWRILAEAEDRPALDAALETLRAGSGRATVEYRSRHHDGRALWLEASLRCVRTDAAQDGLAAARGRRGGAHASGAGGGAAGGAIANIRDVTWRKQAEDELALAAGKLAILAATDGLTALANRRSFDETLQREWRRARRGATHLALLLLDADWFKAYNDQYGHQKGDDALRAIAACITETIKRPGDLGARYGGEEFAVVLPGNADAGAVQVARGIRERLAARAVPHDGTPSGVLTVSIGIASLIVRTERDAADLLAAADAALYAAKRAGRDQIVVHVFPSMALAAD